MAGGSGERFWPLSRKRYPKQLLHLNSEEYCMLAETLNRISSLIPAEDVYIITNELLVDEIRHCLPTLPAENVIPEPAKRNTAPCLALASAYILSRNAELTPSDISIAVLTSDQNISPEEKFIDTVSAALDYAERNKALVTIGIPPTRPDTGYGYIETERPFVSDGKIDIQRVLRFCEKPDLASATHYLETGRFTWNSGMFFWRLDTFISELCKHQSDVGASVATFTAGLQGNLTAAYSKLDANIVEQFITLPSISIDYALMEKSDNVAVCKAIFDWDDIGAWDSLDRTKEHDADGNVRRGKLSLANCGNSIIINDCKRDVIVAGLGLKDIVVIATDDAILVCPKSDVQDIKNTIADIREQFGESHL